MGWLVFEVLLAFGIAVFIVWWTFPKDGKDGKDVKNRGDTGKDQ